MPGQVSGYDPGPDAITGQTVSHCHNARAESKQSDEGGQRTFTLLPLGWGSLRFSLCEHSCGRLPKVPLGYPFPTSLCTFW